MKKFLVFAQCLFLAGVILFSYTTFANETKTLKVKDYTFTWTVNGANIDGTISCQTTGWVSIGFNPSKGMLDANYVMGYVKDGKALVHKEFGVKGGPHKPSGEVGGKDDLANTSGKEVGGVTEISFSMPLKSADGKGTPIDPTKDTKIIMACGKDDNFKSKHFFVSEKTVNLSTGKHK